MVNHFLTSLGLLGHQFLIKEHVNLPVYICVSQIPQLCVVKMFKKHSPVLIIIENSLFLYMKQ